MVFTEKEIKTAIKYVKTDLRDDFWPDICLYEDLFASQVAIEKINFEKYQVSEAVPIDIPKPSLVLRPGHFLSFSDRIFFQLVMDKFAKDVDKILSSKEVSYGYRTTEKQKYFLRDNIAAWLKFKEEDENFFENNPNGYILHTDLSAFFEHIKVKALIKILKNLGVKKNILEQLNNLLMEWSGDGIGIPQGNNCSSFLANVYLTPIDEAMLANDIKYYRFVDDIRIQCTDKNEAREAIKILTELLRPANLHINSGKTEIVDYETFTERKNKYSSEMEAINYNLYGGLIDYSYIDKDLQSIWKDSIGEKKIDKTIFRFCVKRFEAIGSEFPLNDILNNDLYDPAHVSYISDYLCKYSDRADVQAKLLKVLKGSIYDYQKIYLLKTLINSNVLSFSYKEIDRTKIYASNNFLLTGYFLIFAAKFGDNGYRTIIENDFKKSYSHDLRICRYFLIALTFYTDGDSKAIELFKKNSSLAPTYNYFFKMKDSKKTKKEAIGAPA
jgi:hypothetical protein